MHTCFLYNVCNANPSIDRTIISFASSFIEYCPPLCRACPENREGKGEEITQETYFQYVLTSFLSLSTPFSCAPLSREG